MINTDKYNITNNKIICEVLPFYVRGRKIITLLEASIYPIISIHDKFKKWALEKLIEASVTSQPTVLIWYLNHVFRNKFKSEDNSFQIVTDATENGATIWYLEEQILHTGSTPWMPDSESDTGSAHYTNLVTKDLDEESDAKQADIIIFAPKIKESSSYTNEMYIGDIRYYIDKYITVFNITYEITINQE